MTGRLPKEFRGLSYHACFKRRRLKKRKRARDKLSSRLHDTIAAEAAKNPLASPPPACPPGVIIGQLPGRGRALIASHAFRAGEILVEEAPLFAVPMPDSAKTFTCTHCLANLGSAAVHQKIAAGRMRMSDAAIQARLPACECGALYCSERCRLASRARGHLLLCPGLGQHSGEHAAWQRFRAHAQEEAELPELELAAEILAAVLLHECGSVAVGDGGAEARRALVALGFAQEPIDTVLRRDAAGPKAAAETLRQV